MAPDYDHLTLMQKVEVFEHAVNNTAGDDLAKLLWLKSPSSEVSSAHVMADVWQAAKCGIASLQGEKGMVFTCHRLQMDGCRVCSMSPHKGH